jgi:hypothetical protein
MYVKDLAFKAIFKIFSSICKLCFDINAWFCGAKVIFLMHNSQIEEEIFKISLKDKYLTYNVIIPTCWRFEIIPESNLQESYLTNFHKVWFHALRYRIVIT